MVTFADTSIGSADQLQTADVVVFPQVSGSVPHALLHAMMSGAAILATDVGGMRDALGDAGMLVPAGDPVTMAQSLATLLASPGSRRVLGEAARDRALALFSEDRFVQAYRSAYQSLVATRGVTVEPELPQAQHPIIVGAA
jgi:glycosyltransferase involved in cell wall biosynthesis